MWKGYSRAIATGEIFLSFPPESLQQEWEQLNIYAWVWLWSVVLFFTTPIACPQLSCSSELLSSACLLDKLMFPAWFKLTSSERAFPVSWCYVFKVWICCGLSFVKENKQKKEIKEELDTSWIVCDQIFFNVFFLEQMYSSSRLEKSI